MLSMTAARMHSTCPPLMLTITKARMHSTRLPTAPTARSAPDRMEDAPLSFACARMLTITTARMRSTLNPLLLPPVLPS